MAVIPTARQEPCRDTCADQRCCLPAHANAEILAILAVGRQAANEGDITKNVTSIPVGQHLWFTFSEDSVDVKCLDLIRDENGKETTSKLFQSSRYGGCNGQFKP